MKKGWHIKRIGEIAKIKPPKSEARERVSAYTLVSFLPMEDLGISIKYPKAKQTKRLSDVVGSYTYFAEGDVLLAKITPCFENGKLGIAKGLKNRVGFGSSEFIVIRPDSTVSNEWLFHFLSREDFRSEGAKRMGGAVGQQRVPKEFVEGYEIPVPPLAEQQRIVGVLDEACAGLATAQANAKKNVKNARALFESQLSSVFTRRYKGWKPAKLGEEIDLLAGFAFKSAQYTTKEKGVRLLRGDNIIQGCLRWDDVKRWPDNDTKEYERYWLREGDVVLAMDRPWVKAGVKHAMVTSDDLPCLLVQRTARLRGGANLDNRFLKLLIGSSAFTSHILGVQTGIGVPHISGQQIKDFEFMCPPLSKQQRIADNLEALAAEIQRLTQLYKEKQATLAALRKSLLHQAFSGEL